MCTTVINDTGGKFATGTADKFAIGVNDRWQIIETIGQQTAYTLK
jgi:hypothetical protein